MTIMHFAKAASKASTAFSSLMSLSKLLAVHVSPEIQKDYSGLYPLYIHTYISGMRIPR